MVNHEHKLKVGRSFQLYLQFVWQIPLAGGKNATVKQGIERRTPLKGSLTRFDILSRRLNESMGLVGFHMILLFCGDRFRMAGARLFRSISSFAIEELRFCDEMWRKMDLQVLWSPPVPTSLALLFYIQRQLGKDCSMPFASNVSCRHWKLKA